MTTSALHTLQDRWVSSWNRCRSGPARAPVAARSLAHIARQIPGLLSGRKRLLVDISQLYKSEFRAGVQRVTRSILTEWLSHRPAGWSPQPVIFKEDGVWACDDHMVRRTCPTIRRRFQPTDANIAPGNRIIFLDLNTELPGHRDWLLAAKAHGAHLTFVVYDLLPVQSPHWFPDVVGPLFAQWIRMVAELGDDIACISNTVREDFLQWFEKEFGDRPPPRVRHFPLGADPFPACESLLPAAVTDAMGSRPTALMVSTVEPRKGHAQALDALELLWESGIELNLLIAGAEGWKIAPLAGSMRDHPEFGRRLFWLERCSDGQIATCYRDSGVLLAPSFGEGFGLSLVEASRCGRSVIARDLPVFREVAPPGTTLFSGRASGRLADAIRSWLQTRPGPVPPASLCGWGDSARALFELRSL